MMNTRTSFPKFVLVRAQFRAQIIALLIAQVIVFSQMAQAQTAPGPEEISSYTGLHLAAFDGNINDARALIKDNADIEARDSAGRTPVIIAAFASHEDMVELLAGAGADLNAFDNQAYDVVTIAAVADDFPMLDRVLELGANAGNVTSPYEGTALIAAAHLGHHKVVDRLLEAGAPVDHINNLQWTALIEAVVLGDGGPDHTETVRLLLQADADKTIGDSNGVTPLQHAMNRGYEEMVKLLKAR